MKVFRRTVLRRVTGFTLLPVVLTMSLTASIAFLLNRDNGINVNLIGAQSDRARARYAAEAGLQAVNSKAQSLSNPCAAGGYPVSSSDTNFGGADYSASASSSGGSQPALTVTSTGTYNGASVTLSRINVYAFQPGIQTWTTQPGVLGKDLGVVAGSPNSNYSLNDEVILDGSGMELLIQFDLSPLPTGSRIVKWYGAGPLLEPGAKLMLRRNNAGSATESIYVMVINRSWVELLATWNNYTLASPWPSPGIGYDLRPLSTNPYLTVSGWQSLDLTAAANSWRNGLYPNNGVWIRGGPLVVNAKFALSNDLSPSARPKLVVPYLLPCGATAP